MKEVPYSVVKKVWGKMNRMSGPANTKLMEQMGLEQPSILVYLDGVDSDALNEGERGILTFLGMTIWQAMKQAEGTLPQVSPRAMADAETATLKSLESLTPPNEDGSDGIDDIIRACGQGELMDLALEVLLQASGPVDEDDEAESESEAEPAGAIAFEENPDASGPLVRQENVSLIMLDLKTVVDALSASSGLPDADGARRPIER